MDVNKLTLEAVFFYKNSTDVIEFKLNYLMLTFYHLK